MQENPAIILMMDIATRLPRLMTEYSKYDPSDLSACVMKISRRLGGDNTREALEAIESGDLARATEITLRYYDKAYLYGLKKKKEQNLTFINSDKDDVPENAARSSGRLKG
jgi:tRNA 2-selenouridine synthase